MDLTHLGISHSLNDIIISKFRTIHPTSQKGFDATILLEYSAYDLSIKLDIPEQTACLLLYMISVAVMPFPRTMWDIFEDANASQVSSALTNPSLEISCPWMIFPPGLHEICGNQSDRFSLMHPTILQTILPRDYQGNASYVMYFSSSPTFLPIMMQSMRRPLAGRFPRREEVSPEHALDNSCERVLPQYVSTLEQLHQYLEHLLDYHTSSSQSTSMAGEGGKMSNSQSGGDPSTIVGNIIDNITGIVVDSFSSLISDALNADDASYRHSGHNGHHNMLQPRRVNDFMCVPSHLDPSFNSTHTHRRQRYLDVHRLLSTIICLMKKLSVVRNITILIGRDHADAHPAIASGLGRSAGHKMPYAQHPKAGWDAEDVDDDCKHSEYKESDEICHGWDSLHPSMYLHHSGDDGGVNMQPHHGLIHTTSHTMRSAQRVKTPLTAYHWTHSILSRITIYPVDRYALKQLNTELYWELCHYLEDLSASHNPALAPISLSESISQYRVVCLVKSSQFRLESVLVKIHLDGMLVFPLPETFKDVKWV